MRTRTEGYIAALLATTIFSAQDGISKHLAASYDPIFITMMRYWAFALFAVVLAANLPGGVKATMRTQRPWLQVARGVLLALQVVLAITSFDVAGLARTQAIFSATPLIVVLLAIPFLGERVGWRRWTAIVVGLLGVLLIVRPGGGFFETAVLVPLAGAVNFALYVIATRMVGRVDSAMTSFFYTGVVGAAAITLVGPFYWATITGWNWAWMGVLCLTSASGHYLLIRAYSILDAAAVQPIMYLSVVYAAAIGLIVFDETLGWTTIVGTIVIVGAGIFTIWRDYARRASQPGPVAEAEHP